MVEKEYGVPKKKLECKKIKKNIYYINTAILVLKGLLTSTNFKNNIFFMINNLLFFIEI